MWSRYTTYDSAAQEKNSALIDSEKFYELIPDGTRIFFGDKSSVVAVHDSCICGLLFCSMKSLLFTEIPSFDGALWHHENFDKVLESVDNNKISERDAPLSHFWGSCNKRLDECAASSKAISIRTPTYTHQENDMPLIDFLREECRCFFRKLFSFSNSAFSRRRRRSSSIISNWYFSSSLFWHSSRYERTQLETVALDMPYSATRLAIVRPSWMCTRTTFRLIFESCVFLLYWHYNLSARDVKNSLYHYKMHYNLHSLYIISTFPLHFQKLMFSS